MQNIINQERFMKIINKKLGRQKALGQAFSQGKIIELDSRLKNKEHLEILIHEVLHILNWEWKEEKVIQQSRKIANVIWKENYRRCEL